MIVSTASAGLIDELKRLGLAKKNHCYSNSAQIVLGILRGEGKYVLCWIWDAKGVKHGHAIIEFKGIYHDITLQVNGGIASRYEHFRTLSAVELQKMIADAGGDIRGPNGFTPPALLPDGSVACVAVAI